MEIDVQANHWGEILDFEARVAALEGVEHVAIVAIDNERARLTVELRRHAARESA